MSEWRPIPGYEDLYEVSSEGVIRSLKSGKALSTRSSVGSGYVQANLWKNGVRKRTTGACLLLAVVFAFMERQR